MISGVFGAGWWQWWWLLLSYMIAWKRKKIIFSRELCLGRSVGLYQIVGSLIESKYLGSSWPGIKVFHRWVKMKVQECSWLKNMQRQGLDVSGKKRPLDLLLIPRSDSLSWGDCQGQFCMGRNDFCLGMNLDEFGQVLSSRRHPGGRDKGHTLPSHSDSTPRPLLLYIIHHFTLINCNHTIPTRNLAKNLWEFLFWNYRAKIYAPSPL